MADEIKDILRRNFCNNLIKWKAENWTGSDTELADKLGVTRGQLSNVLKMRRCGDESWRRMVAQKIGIPYETMIGVEKAAHNEAFTGVAVRTRKLLQLAAEVLESNTQYAIALENNIELFHAGMHQYGDRLRKKRKNDQGGH